VPGESFDWHPPIRQKPAAADELAGILGVAVALPFLAGTPAAERTGVVRLYLTAMLVKTGLEILSQSQDFVLPLRVLEGVTMAFGLYWLWRPRARSEERKVILAPDQRGH
jgi:hypothetical protein